MKCPEATILNTCRSAVTMAAIVYCDDKMYVCGEEYILML